MTLNTWQAYALLAWPLITALASMGYALLDKTSKGHAVLSFLAGLGLDLPKLLDALKRIVAPPSTFVSAKGPDGEVVRFRDPKSRGCVEVKVLLPLALGAIAIVIAAVLQACIPNPASQVQDGLSLEACIQKNWGKPFLTVVTTCGPQEEQAVADAIADIVVFLDARSDGGALAGPEIPYANEPAVVAALPAARARAAQAQ